MEGKSRMSPKVFLTWVIGGSIAVAVAARATATVVALRGELRRTETELALLTSQVSQLRSEVGARTAAPLAAARPDPERYGRERLERLEAAFGAEARDRGWSEETSSAFRTGIMRGDRLRRALQTIDCRSETCRLEMADDRSPEFQQELQQLALDVGTELPSMAFHFVTKPDGTRSVVYFWSKHSRS
jgi:hypothetical protein